MFAAHNLHPIWKHLKPVETTSSSDGGLEQARSLYHLIEPVISGQWERYVVLRKAAEADFYGTLRATRHLHKLHPLMTQIRNGVTFVVRNTTLQKPQQLALADGIVPLTLNVTRSKYVRIADHSIYFCLMPS